jgi:hypothetical protein
MNLISIHLFSKKIDRFILIVCFYPLNLLENKRMQTKIKDLEYNKILLNNHFYISDNNKRIKMSENNNKRIKKSENSKKLERKFVNKLV